MYFGRRIRQMCLWGWEKLTWGSAAMELWSSKELGCRASGMGSSQRKDGLCSECKDTKHREGDQSEVTYFNFVGTVKAWASCLKSEVPRTREALKRKVSTNMVFRCQLYLNSRMLSQIILPHHLPIANLHWYLSRQHCSQKCSGVYH